VQWIGTAIDRVATAKRNATADEVVNLAEQWWSSSNTWEEMVAVRVRAAAQAPVHHAALLAKLDPDRPAAAAIAHTAIDGLTGEAEPGELDLLRRIITRPEDRWVFARRAATRRLLRIGGSDAEAILDQHYLADGLGGEKTWTCMRPSTVVGPFARSVPSRYPEGHSNECWPRPAGLRRAATFSRGICMS
jgi:hypothetical protein